VIQLTAQDAYEKIREYFTRPGAVLARDPDPTAPSERNFVCSYRTTDGHACAFGCLIPDDLYDKNSMEGKSAPHVLDSHPELARMFNVEARRFIDVAQGTHDSSATTDVPNFIFKLDLEARAFGLKAAA
jgi:hypothetical protein